MRDRISGGDIYLQMSFTSECKRSDTTGFEVWPPDNNNTWKGPHKVRALSEPRLDFIKGEE